MLEGRECGGHVGPRSSFVLWEQAVAVVADAIDRGIPADEISLVFAGGIHDARSAALVAALAGPAGRARGARSACSPAPRTCSPARPSRPARSSRASRRRPFAAARRCCSSRGPGHQVRVSRTPFVARFDEERQRLIAEGRPAEEIREALEGLNVGRLRVAAKGVDRSQGGGLAAGRGQRRIPDDPRPLHARPGRRPAQPDDHHRGSSTARSARGAPTFLEREIPEVVNASDELDRRGRRTSRSSAWRRSSPGARAVSRFWSNTLRGFDAITEVPPDRWDWRLYYDPDPKAPDKIVSKWGGFLPDVAFDPLRYGMPPVEPAARSSRRNCWRWRWSGRRWPMPATPSGLSPESRRPSCWAWAAERPSWRWATPSARTCRCSIR